MVSLEQAVAAPFATRQLADLGARVIKIERPGTGDFARAYDETVHGQSSYFVWLNRSKESITLDVKSAAGREILQSLLGMADVFVQNLGPGAAARLGLDPKTPSERHPRLIPCAITGYGGFGPWSGRKAYDLLVQCETGLVSVTGTPEEAVKAGISVADIAAGMYAFSGILTALFHRAMTSVVRPVEVSLFEALGEWMSQPANYARYGGRPPARTGAEHATIAPYGPYRTTDGGTVLLAIQNEREWVSFCREVLGDESIAMDPRFVRNSTRVAHRAELNALIDERLGRLTTETVTKALDRARVANARLNTVADFLEHPVLRERSRWRDVEIPGGHQVEALVPPVTIEGLEPRMDPVPALGQHTDSILAELGFDRDHIERLRSAGVI